VNQRKMDSKTLIQDQVLHTIGIGEDVEEVVMEETFPGEIPEYHLPQDPKEAKTPGIVPHRAAGETPGGIPPLVLTTVGQTPLLGTLGSSGGTPPLPGGTEVP